MCKSDIKRKQFQLKKHCAALIICVLSIGLSLTANADGGSLPADNWYIITSHFEPGISLHPEPDKDSAVLLSAPFGTVFQAQAREDNYVLTEIDGVLGWINIDYADEIEAPTSNQDSTGTRWYRIVSEFEPGISLHPEPDKDSEVLLSAPYGTVFQAFDQIDNYVYTEINGIRGWINIEYAKEIEDPGRTAPQGSSSKWYKITSHFEPGISLHLEPDKDSEVLLSAPYGTIFQSLDQKDNYVLTEIDGVTGWINTDYAIEIEDPNVVSWEAEANNGAGEQVLLTEDEAYASVYDFIDATMNTNTIYKYHGYIVLDQETDTEYVIRVRSYTSAIGFYYVNKYTGEVDCAWENMAESVEKPLEERLEERKYQYTIDGKELSRIRTPVIEEVFEDGAYYYMMITETNGHPNIAGDLIEGCACSYSYDSERITIFGSANYTADEAYIPSFSEEDVLDDIFRSFRYDSNTVFTVGEGDSSLSVDEFMDYVENVKDTGLMLIVAVRGGITTSFTIAS